MVGAREAANRLKCSPGTIHRMAVNGKFPAWRVGRGWRYAWHQIQNATGQGLRALP
jgi:excisionase family DNA binding protein